MRILGYIGTFNEPVGEALDALLAQSTPLEDLILVDNASSENVIPKQLPENVTVVRVPRNQGPNSAVAAGLQYALDHGYDWMWLLESDGAPHPDALEKLVELHDALPPVERDRIGILASALVLQPEGRVFEGRLVTPGGMRVPRTVPGQPYWECDQLLWNGAMFRMQAVAEVGLPRLGKGGGYWDDFSQDYGDTEYTYRIRKAGYRLLVHRESLVDQRVGRSTVHRLLGRDFVTTRHSPIRRYLFFRNLTYFWRHVYAGPWNWISFMMWFSYRLAAVSAAILLWEDDRALKLRASLRGVVDGWAGRVSDKYPPDSPGPVPSSGRTDTP